MRIPILAALLALPALAGPPAKSPVVADKIADRFTPAAFERQHIEGILGDRMRVNLEGRLLRVDEKALIDCFQHRPGPQDWAGEHAGKFLHAAANTWLYTGDQRLKTLMDRLARNLIATQLPDGYLGTYTDDKRWTSWDVWVHKYDLLGLLNYYQATGDEPALEASRKIGDLLARTFGTGAGQRDIIAAGTHMGMAATSVLEAMVNLYRFTGDRKYLDFCEYLVRSWDQPNGPKIGASLLATGSVFRTANAKAYEMMSNLVGLVELYRVTGKAEYLKPAEIAWKDIVAHRLYVTGTTSAAEHFQDDFVLPGEEASNVGEGCATVTFLQLTWQLLRVTGEAAIRGPTGAHGLQRATGRAGPAQRRHLLLHAAERQEVAHAGHQLLRVKRAARNFDDPAVGLGKARRWRRGPFLRAWQGHRGHWRGRGGHRVRDHLPIGRRSGVDGAPGESGTVSAVSPRAVLDGAL